MIIVTMPATCTECGSIVHALIQSQAEYDGFRCEACITRTINTILTETPEEVLLDTEQKEVYTNTSSDIEGGELK
jgi:DNA-directed RNA polymerase subunit RPC12/RpoP